MATRAAAEGRRARSADERNVRRVDHHHFHGWLVRLKRAGTRHERYFHDQGDRKAARARAILWRDRTAARLPPPRKFKHTYSLNKTGVVGVYLARSRTRTGTRVCYYCATWVEATGQARKRLFSVVKYGAAKAFEMATHARKKASPSNCGRAADSPLAAGPSCRSRAALMDSVLHLSCPRLPPSRAPSLSRARGAVGEAAAVA